MLFRLLLAVTFVVGFTSAFSPFAACRPSRSICGLKSAASAQAETAKPTAASALERIGIEQEQLALGVNANEVADFIGTRESLIERTLKDVPSFDRHQAEGEVDKFLLDSEAVTMMIQFYKMKAEDPDFEVPDNKQEEDGFFSFRTLVIGYVVYVAYTSLPVVFRKYVDKQETAGTWHGTNIKLIDDWLATAPAVTATSDAAQSLSTTDAIQSATDTIQAVADVVN